MIALAAAIAGIRLPAGGIVSAGAETISADGAETISADGEETISADGTETGSEVGENLSADEGASSGTSAAAEEEPEYDHVATELETGRAYLASLEERTPVEMEYLIEQARKEYERLLRLEAYKKKREDYRESLSGSKLWEAFDDYVFLGDSRVVGYDVFGFLSSERILAAAGDTINSITNRMDEVKKLSPKYIFISYGINDIGMGYWPTAQEYTDAFLEKIHALQKELPDAEIYVNSIIPARDDALEWSPIWAGLPEYSEAVRAMCEKEEIPFIDNDAIIREHEDLYASDGVHLQSDFYRYWGENQMLGVFDNENGHLSF